MEVLVKMELTKRLNALFKEAEEHKKDPEYMRALTELDAYLSHKAGK